ncbi:MAG: hypothetical protein OXM55_03690 [Bdellovibrionales bacterium]|nr:hypothetical protein [Bdellovibrionales bacterium]
MSQSQEALEKDRFKQTTFLLFGLLFLYGKTLPTENKCNFKHRISNYFTGVGKMVEIPKDKEIDEIRHSKFHVIFIFCIDKIILRHK